MAQIPASEICFVAHVKADIWVHIN